MYPIGAGRRRTECMLRRPRPPAAATGIADMRQSRGGPEGLMNDTRFPVMQTFIVHVENEPGVLARVASLFRRRGFNIESVTIGLTEQEGVSRMTIVTEQMDRRAPGRVQPPKARERPQRGHGRRRGDRLPRSRDDQGRRRRAVTAAHHVDREGLPRVCGRSHAELARPRGVGQRGDDRPAAGRAEALRGHRDGANRPPCDEARRGGGRRCGCSDLRRGRDSTSAPTSPGPREPTRSPRRPSERTTWQRCSTRTRRICRSSGRRAWPSSGTDRRDMLMP